MDRKVQGYLLKSPARNNFIDVVDGTRTYYGGSQNWYRDKFKVMNGCGPVAGANLLAFLSENSPVYRKLYSGNDYSKDSYLKFMDEIYDAIRPSFFGLISMGKFIKSLQNYSKSKGYELGVAKLNRFNINFSRYSCLSFIKNALMKNIPVGAYNLDFRKKLAFSWHWIVITGIYLDENNEIMLSISSWGARYDIEFDHLYKLMRYGGGLVYFY